MTKQLGVMLLTLAFSSPAASATTQPGRILAQAYFHPLEARVQHAARPGLDRLARHLVAHPELTLIEIDGHTDPGESAHSEALSRRRAERVVSYLVEHGVSRDRFITAGWGAYDPAFPSDSDLHRARNRRVVIRVLARE